MKKETSFGLMEILNENPLVERMTFEREGKSHTHNQTEYCYVLEGSGRIVGANREDVAEGDLVSIPPQTDHYMIPSQSPFKLLIFYEE